MPTGNKKIIKPRGDYKIPGRVWVAKGFERGIETDSH
jgi:hypothetical protein